MTRIVCCLLKYFMVFSIKLYLSDVLTLRMIPQYGLRMTPFVIHD